MKGGGAEATPSGEAGRAEHLAVVTHELRSPVAALTALAEAAGQVPAEERARLVALAIAAARDLERILADSEHLSLRRRDVDLGALALSLRTERVSVSVAGRPLVDGDPTRLRQALTNIVANGLRHGSRVAVGVREAGDLVVCEVSDDGPGVDLDLDVFARGVSGAGSSGLGLWLARAISEAHGGSLELVREDAPGARFRLCLPSASGGP